MKHQKITSNPSTSPTAITNPNRSPQAPCKLQTLLPTLSYQPSLQSNPSISLINRPITTDWTCSNPVSLHGSPRGFPSDESSIEAMQLASKKKNLNSKLHSLTWPRRIKVGLRAPPETTRVMHRAPRECPKAAWPFQSQAVYRARARSARVKCKLRGRFFFCRHSGDGVVLELTSFRGRMIVVRAPFWNAGCFARFVASSLVIRILDTSRTII